MEQVHHLNASILHLKFLVLGPPFPRNTVVEFSDFLDHGTRIVQDPFDLFLFAHARRMHTNAFVERFLHVEHFVKLVRAFHSMMLLSPLHSRSPAREASAEELGGSCFLARERKTC